jgi:N-acetylmuramoyl-L-alanine amidase
MTKVALIVGHNPVKKGASFPHDGNKVYEYPFWVDFTEEIEHCFEDDKEVEIQTFFREDFNSFSTEIETVYSETDDWGADVTVECHFNSHTSKASGYEVLYVSQRGKQIANVIDDSFDVYLRKYKDRNTKRITKGQRGYRNLTSGKAPAVIIEPFFAIDGEDFIDGESRELLKFAFIDFLKKV